MRRDPIHRPAFPAQPDDLGLDGCSNPGRAASRPGGTVLQARQPFFAKTLAPFVNCAGADPHRAGNVIRVLPAIQRCDLHLSTFRRQTVNLVDVHSALPQLDAVRASLSARDTGDGLRRSRQGVCLLWRSLRLGDPRQRPLIRHWSEDNGREDRGGYDRRWQ